jgi:histidyl-tRNA synthetase
LDIKSIKFTEQIKSVLDPTGLEHLEQCTSYLTQEDMGIKNVKLKKDLLQGIEKYKKIELEALRPSKSACKELFTLVLN